MRVPQKAVISIIISCFFFAGCSSLKEDVVDEFGHFFSEPVNDEIEGEAQDTYTPQQMETSKRFALAMRLLGQGEADKARAELAQYLIEKPNSERAKEIIKQIDTPSHEYYPSNYFSVKLKKGESLSTLARDYLGDAYYFWGLAKYNDISEPAVLKAGQMVKIPGTKKALRYRANLVKAKIAKAKPKVKTKPKTKKATPDEEAKTAVAVESVKPVAKTLDGKLPTIKAAQSEQSSKPEESTAPEKSTVPEKSPEPEKVMQPRDLMNAALNKGDYVAAASNLDTLISKGDMSSAEEKQAVNIYTQAAKALENSDPKLASSYYLKSANLQIKHGQKEDAIPSLQKAKKLDPGNHAIDKIYRPIQQEYADKYHKEASIAYRKQELDEAITLWNKVLKINPDHSAAKAYLAQAKELKKKLADLKER